ncbi:MAG TPA: VTT domain-containing protein [Candidatus Dormibacteraeota bacterium]|nr:VTT domain-containing protein [Candidatus Dormibacteraeota bacterium]
MVAEVHALLNGSGFALIAAICGLILVEELGIPMPFAPGDLLLVLAGVSIATSHLNPLAVVAATYASAVIGALGGREIFERLGAAALPRLAAILHAEARVDGLTARLRRGGAIAVFTGRITPGLRVVTNEVAGLVAMPRRTFLTGLLPAVAVYQAVFMGLGIWLGPAAWKTIEHHAPNPALVLLLVVAVFAVAWAVHALGGRFHAPAVRLPRVLDFGR